MRTNSSIMGIVLVIAASLRAGDQLEKVWDKKLGGIHNDWLRGVDRDVDGNYIVVGTSYSADRPLAGDVYVAKLNSEGSVIWEKTFDHLRFDEGRSVVAAEDGYIVVGATGGEHSCGLDCVAFNVYKPDMYLSKLSSVGEVSWQLAFGGDDIDTARAVVGTGSGEFIVVGQTRSYGAGLDDVIVLRLNASGDVLSHNTVGGPGKDIAYSLVRTVDGYMVVGKTNSFDDATSIYLINLDRDGQFVWQKTIGDNVFNFTGRAIVQTGDLNYAIAGSIGGDAGYILKVDASGAVLWDKRLKPLVELGSIIEIENGVLLAAGLRLKTPDDVDVYVARVDKNGDTAQEFVLGSDVEDESGHGLIDAGEEGWWLVGHVIDDSSQQDGYIIKIESSYGVFLRGDANVDSNVSVSDAVYILMYLFLGSPDLCEDAMDANDDGAVSITDAIHILEYLFRSGPALSKPNHPFGLDVTIDGLGCLSR